MDVYGLSDKGLRRELNEDSYIYEVNKRGDLLVCVCDGIGGSAAGEAASILNYDVPFLMMMLFSDQTVSGSG